MSFWRVFFKVYRKRTGYERGTKFKILTTTNENKTVVCYCYSSRALLPAAESCMTALLVICLYRVKKSLSYPRRCVTMVTRHQRSNLLRRMPRILRKLTFDLLPGNKTGRYIKYKGRYSKLFFFVNVFTRKTFDTIF